MPSYDHLRTAAFLIHLASGGSWIEPFFGLQFPEAWKQLLLPLMTSRSGGARSLPIDSLNRALVAVVPDLVTISRGVGRLGDQRTWLYSRQQIPPSSLAPIVHAWVREAFRDHSPSTAIDSVVGQLQPTDLAWESGSVDLGNWSTSPNGTADPAAEAFLLLPDVLAEHLSRPGISLEHGLGTSEFRRVPVAGGDGAELMSWPPMWLPDYRGELWPMSLTLRFRLETLAFERDPQVHCSVGVRRWVDRPFTSRSGQDASVYLASQVPWIHGVHNSQSFQMAPITWKSIPKKQREEDGPTGTLEWGKDLPGVLNRLAFQTPLPLPAQFCVSPKQMLAPGEVMGGIVYSTGMTLWNGPKDHGLGTGLMPADRRPILLWVESTLGALGIPLRLAPQSGRVMHRVAIERDDDAAAAFAQATVPVPPPEPDEDEEQRAKRLHDVDRARARVAVRHARRTALAAQMPNLTVDLLYLTEEGRDRQLQAIRDDLGLPAAAEQRTSPDLHRWSFGGQALTVRTRWLGKLGDDLPVAGSVRYQRDAVRAAEHERVGMVKRELPPAAEPSAALIELHGPDHYGGNEAADPKFALRRGCIEAGRISQFFTPQGVEEPDSAAMHRASSAWRDLMRQLGILVAPPRFRVRDGDVPDPVQYVGIWLIRTWQDDRPWVPKQRLPVAVRLASNSTDVLAYAPGLGHWLPYPAALKAIACMHPYAGANRDQAQVQAFIEQVLDDVGALGDAVVMVHAQNLRLFWPWLQNKHIGMDGLAFGEKPAEPISQRPGIRVIRVRTSDQGETPECFGEDEDSVGFPEALWTMGATGRVFASTAGKPVTAKRLSANLSKLGRWRSRSMDHEPSPGATAFNPQLVEHTVAAIQAGDQAWALAALGHKLRYAASHYDGALTLALPLHLAKLIEEYVLPMSELETYGAK
jgi:hypothetical protein